MEQVHYANIAKSNNPNNLQQQTNNGIQQYINNAVHKQQLNHITASTNSKNIKPNAITNLQQKIVLDYQPQINNNQQSLQQQNRQSVNFYPSQQQEIGNSSRVCSQNQQKIQRLKENQDDVIDQLNQFMQKQTSNQHQQVQKLNTKTNPMRESTNIMRLDHQQNLRTKQSSKLHANQDMQKVANDKQFRMSSIGFINDTEQEDYDKYQQIANDYQHNEQDLLVQQTKQRNAQQQPSLQEKLVQQQLSKSPTPIIYNSQAVNTPTSLNDIKSSYANPMSIFNQFSQQQHHRNPSTNLNHGFKSHQLPNQQDNGALLQEKKKSVSIANSYQTANTFSNSNISNHHKRQSGINNNNLKNKNENNHIINSIIGSGSSSNTSQVKSYTQAHTANTSKEPHKKSQSLYNKKIVDIISGLQQSLGVIASNVQNSFNTQNDGGSIGSGSNGPLLKGDQQKALLESALLAQKIAQMTSGMRKDSIISSSNLHIKKNSDIERMAQQVGKDQSNKRKSMKITSNFSGRGSLNIIQKHKQGFKTLEDTTQNEKIKKNNNSNRMSIDFQQQKIKSSHQRNRSDLQNPRKNIATSMQNPSTNNFNQGYHSKQNTLLTCSNSSIDNPINNQHNILMISDDQTSINPNSIGNLPSSVKSLNRINQAVKQGIFHFAQNNDRMTKKKQSSNTIDNTIMSSDAALAAKYRSAVTTNPQSSGQSSMITNTIDYPRQSIGNSQQRKHATNINSGERLSEAAYLSNINNKNKLLGQLIIQPNNDHQYDQRLKSVASSPSLHNHHQNQQYSMANTTNQGSNQQLLKKKTHQSSQSNTIFDFGTQNHKKSEHTSQVTYTNLNDKQQKISSTLNQQQQKKKNLMVASKKDSQTTKSEQNSSITQSQHNHHKRTSSDGSSLTKMFHFKQQMLINKIFQQQQQTQQVVVVNQGQNTNLNINKKQKVSQSKNNNYQQAERDHKALKKAKVQVISSLSSKRLSNEENQENMMSNINYQSPRGAHNVLNQKQNNQQLNNLNQPQVDVKLSQDMRSFLQKFKNKNVNESNNIMGGQTHSTVVGDVQQQQKQLLIQAITQQQAINSQGFSQQKQFPQTAQNESSYFTTQKHQPYQNSNLKQNINNLNSNLTSEKKDYLYQGTFEQQNKRQSQQVQKAHQIIQSHKRAKSDANKHSSQQSQNTQLKAQHIINQANNSKQKMFFLNLNQQQQQQQQQHYQQTILTNNTNLQLLNSKDYGSRMNTNALIGGLNQNPKLNTLNENYQHMPYSCNNQHQNLIYSARASPTRLQNNIYYNFDENTQNTLTFKQQLQNNNQNENKGVKPFISTARSETSAKMINKEVVGGAMSNQTTQKKVSQSNNINNNRLIESVNTRLIYPDIQNQDQLLINNNSKQNYAQTILQSQQFTKLASILYGTSTNNMPGGANTFYSTLDNQNLQNQNDSLVYKIAQNKDDQIYSNLQSDNYGIGQLNHNKQFFLGNSSDNSSLKHFDYNSLLIKSVNQSPKLKVMPTPKLNQPGGATQITNFYDNLVNSQAAPTNMGIQQQLQQQQVNTNFMISPVLQQQQQKLMNKPKVQEYQVLHTEQELQDDQEQDKELEDLLMNSNHNSNQQHDYLKILKNGNQEPALGQIQVHNKEFEGYQFQTFESNLTTHTINNLTPRSRDKQKLIKQIKLSFNKLKEPIKTTSEFYRIGKMLGKGAFGRVNLAIHKLCNQLVAVKSINKQFLSEDESSKKKMMQEVLILQKTRHDNLVRLYDSFETNKHIVFVMELCAGGDLLNYVRKRRKLKEPVAKYVFKQVVAGLHYCHQKGIVHRDMKLDNLLLDEQGIVKICDFGVSKLLTSPQEIMTEQCGTPAYIAPEILKDKGYKGFGVDIWSLGVCLYAMLFGTVPFKANNMSELHQLIMKAKYSFKEDNKGKDGEQQQLLSEDVKNLIKLLLEPNPDKRITMQGILNHQWMQDDPSPDSPKIEIFTEQELETIRKDFTYQDMSRYKRNLGNKKKQQNLIQQQSQQHMQLQNQNNQAALGVGGVVTTEENLFTEHALDSTQNVLMKNCSTKSIVLAPFNSTRTHIAKEDLPPGFNSNNNDQDMRPSNDNDDDSYTYIPPLPIDPNMIVDKRVIKYAPRVKDINRQYEMNNNCELDNGVYNKFVKQSTENADNNSQNQSKSDNSLITSMNGDCQENLLLNNNPADHQQYAAPLVSQNSDVEAELSLLKKQHNNKLNEQSDLHTMLHQKHLVGKSEFTQAADEPVLIDYEVVERVEQFGYPRKFVIESIEQYEMNDAATNYYLLDKEKQQVDDYNNAQFLQ